MLQICRLSFVLFYRLSQSQLIENIKMNNSNAEISHFIIQL